MSRKIIITVNRADVYVDTLTNNTRLLIFSLLIGAILGGGIIGMLKT